MPPPQAARSPAVRWSPGGAQRLGREIALALARAGWDIAVHFGRSQQQALATVADIRALGLAFGGSAGPIWPTKPR